MVGAALCYDRARMRDSSETSNFCRGSTAMKYLILATTMIAMMSNGAVAREHDAGRDLQNASATPVSSEQQGAATLVRMAIFRIATFRIAMGPTSAAQKSAGPVKPPVSTPPKCSSAVGSCPNDKSIKKHSKT